jgi:3-oxoacyl-[acyl-carrier protein] reductase
MGRPPLNVLVTGSSGSIGEVLVRNFLGEGHRVVGIDKNAPSRSPAGAAPGSWDFLRADLSDGTAAEATFAEHYGPDVQLDVVVNAAGLITNAPALTLKNGKLEHHAFDLWDRTLAATLSTVFYVSVLAARQMVSRGTRGVIINISSICAHGNAGQPAYSAAKAGVNALTVSLAKELGPLGIRVAAIAPGVLDTTSTRAALSENALDRLRKQIPLQVLGDAEHVLHAVRFILDNPYVHGKVIEVDGGLTL